MNKLKVINVKSDSIEFENGVKLFSNHEQDCCENHWLDFSDLTIEDFKGLEFDLTTSDFFKEIVDYGIELVPLSGWSIRVPGYGSNNGYYSSNLDLIIDNEKGFRKEFNISDCQSWEPY